MLGEEIWCVMVNGTKYKGDLTRKEAEAIAERHQRGLCKHRDFGDHVEVKRDRSTIENVNAYYKDAKEGKLQTYQLQGWRE